MIKNIFIEKRKIYYRAGRNRYCKFMKIITGWCNPSPIYLPFYNN